MSQNNPSQEKILLADSSSLVLSILKRILEKEGFSVITATDGNMALDLIKSEKPTCVAVNSKLPVIDGPSLCRIIKHGMKLKSTTCVVFCVDARWRKSADFSCVDIEILASENEAEALVSAIKDCFDLKVENQTEEDLPVLDLSSVEYATRAMEQNLHNFYIMESLYKCGFYVNDIDIFSKKLISIVKDVFSVDTVVLIVNSEPIQLYGTGIVDNEYGQAFLRVCLSDFREVDENRTFSKIETHFLDVIDELDENQLRLSEKESFSSYKCFPLIGESLLGTIHIASHEKMNCALDMDEIIGFFSEKVSIFLSQVIYYKKSSQIENRLRSAFSRFVPKEIIDELAEVGDADIGSTNEKRKVAVLISDIRNFTTISEVNQPENVVSFLNGYFSRMVEVIKKHGGTIDKFMGDAVMALFGAPVSYEDNARRAVEAALEMKSLIPEISCETLTFPEDTTFDIGIGIHYGEVIAGSIGCKEKTDYTVIGDTVNLASRLEGLTKSYGAEIIISGAVKNELPKGYNLLHLDNVKVKGKTVGVEIYRVDVEEIDSSYKDSYTKAIGLYESGAWNLAQSYFEKALNQKPNDKSAFMMAQRCKKFIQNPPETWDGAYSLTNK